MTPPEILQQCVHQVPFSVLFSAFPELRFVWNSTHSQWRNICHKEEWKARFRACQDDQQQRFYQETFHAPDMEYYQTLERLGEEKYWSEALGQGWFLNRGKISYPKLAWLSQFEQRGVFWYPNGGFREWHSNYPYNQETDVSGWRIYLVDVETEGQSGFQYLNSKGELVHCADRKGYANVFWLPRTKFFWHAVYSKTNRFSCGFRPLPHVSRAVSRVIEDVYAK